MVIILSDNNAYDCRKIYKVTVAYLSIEHVTRLLIFPKLKLGCQKSH